MFIQTEQTPNPASLKFLPGCEVMVAGTAEFTALEKAEEASPLAARLMKIDGVSGVFLGRDFVTVTKSDAASWTQIKPLLLGALLEPFTTGQSVMHDENLHAADHAAQSTAHEDDDEVVRQIKELLDTRIRPAVAADGGDIVFASFEDGVVYLQMRGACAGCPSSTATLKTGIENLLRHFIPEVTEVRPVN